MGRERTGPGAERDVEMSVAGIACAYLVTSMIRTPGGALALEGETVCHDRDLALEIARADSLLCDWVGVYLLEAEGRLVSSAPIYSAGAPARAAASGD